MSIYESIGGEAALVAVMDDLYERILADPALKPFFEGSGIHRLKGRQVEFFAQALGGPARYEGRTMKDAHLGRGIGSADFDLVAGHLVAALAAAGVPGETISEIADLVLPLKADIVAGRMPAT
ncbi:group 1 truncated hemoglobin [Actinomadura sp. 21ATH]|uniref:group I truncated hemoglobin n=1 Tax=Actinomadura sp. 21ATH TaxID=1735444 RepID=UPI0035C1DAC0